MTKVAGQKVVSLDQLKSVPMNEEASVELHLPTGHHHLFKLPHARQGPLAEDNTSTDLIDLRADLSPLVHLRGSDVAVLVDWCV